MPDAEQKSKNTRLPLEYLLGKLKERGTVSAESMNVEMFDPRYGHHFPWFNLFTVRTMMLDPRIRYGLYLIKGPIMTYTKFFNSEEAESNLIHTAIVELNYHFPYGVFCDNKDTEEFIIDQLNRFWEVGIAKALTAIEYGYSASEVRYKQCKDKLVFDNLYMQLPTSTQVLTKNRGIIGFVRNKDRSTYVPIGKGFWHVHQRERNRYYGESILKGAHIPWHETWTLGGARDIRRTWFFKNAYDGGQLYYPEGSYIDQFGQEVMNEELAVRLLENKRAGSAMSFPSTRGTDGKYEWVYEPPKACMTPEGMQDYIDQLRDEELEGLGIPPEVVQGNSGSAIGSATGRMVPLMAFIAGLTPIATHLIGDFCEQILPVLLQANGMNDEYIIRRIVPKVAEGNTAKSPFDPERTPGEDDDHSKKPQPKQTKTVQTDGKKPNRNP